MGAYFPLLRFCNADLPHLVTVRGLIPKSREAWVRETFSDRIFEITESTRSHVSLNFSGFPTYWASVRGAACLVLARGLLKTRLPLGTVLLFGFFGEESGFFFIVGRRFVDSCLFMHLLLSAPKAWRQVFLFHAPMAQQRKSYNNAQGGQQ